MRTSSREGHHSLNIPHLWSDKTNFLGQKSLERQKTATLNSRQKKVPTCASKLATLQYCLKNIFTQTTQIQHYWLSLLTCYGHNVKLLLIANLLLLNPLQEFKKAMCLDFLILMYYKSLCLPNQSTIPILMGAKFRFYQKIQVVYIDFLT